MGSSNRNIDYRCTLCGEQYPRELLTIKQAQFKNMNGKILKTRVVSWLCPRCLGDDQDNQLPARATAPGMRDTRLAASG